MPVSIAPTRGRWLVYKTRVWEGVKEKGSLYFFSAAILSVEANCLVEEVDRRTPSSFSPAINKRLALVSAISCLALFFLPAISTSEEIVSAYEPNTRAMVFQNVDLPLFPSP